MYLPGVEGSSTIPAYGAPAVPQGPTPSPLPPNPFALTPARDDTGLYQDARTGFSHLLPGRPSLGMPRAGEPPADAVVHLQDAPITVRYKLQAPSITASSAAELARATAEQFASWRAHSRVMPDFANPTWLVSWGVEAGAVAGYESGASREELFLLVRQGMVMVVTWTYPKGFVDDPAYASFASVAEATMIWDPIRWEQQGRVWPESQFMGPGLHGRPKPAYNEAAKLLAQAPIAADERAAMLGLLSGVISGVGAPWVALAPEVLAANHRAMLNVARENHLRAFIEMAFAEVRTAHDLRGLAVLLGRALDPRRPSAPPLPSVPPTLTGAPTFQAPPTLPAASLPGGIPTPFPRRPS